MAEAPENRKEIQGSIGPLLAAPEEPGGQPAEAYRPLSLLAIAGFTLGVIYALAVLIGGLAQFAARNSVVFLVLMVLGLVGGALGPMLARERRPARLAASAGIGMAIMASILGLGGLVAFAGSNPWTLPGWMWLFVAAAIFISWLARSRIQASEGTLEGATLARWGMLLALFFGAYYFLYETANTFAVRNQARAAAEEFLDAVRKGELQEAFIMTLRPGERPPAGADARAFIEAAHNTTRAPQMPGGFTAFRTSDYIRYIQNAGGADKVQYTYLSGRSEFRDGGYEVNIEYKVTTPGSTFEIYVSVFGQESGSEGRRWYVLGPRTGRNQTKPVTFTESGQDMDMRSNMASATAYYWCRGITYGQTEYTYLETLPTAVRQRQTRALVLSSPAGEGLIGLASLPAAGPESERQAAHKGYQAFLSGSILDFKNFWADDKFRKRIIAAMPRAVANTSPGALDLDLLQTRVPLITPEGNDRAIFSFGVRGNLHDAGQGFLVEGDLLVEGPTQGNPTPEKFRVVGLRMQRAQTALTMPGEGGM